MNDPFNALAMAGFAFIVLAFLFVVGAGVYVIAIMLRDGWHRLKGIYPRGQAQNPESIGSESIWPPAPRQGDDPGG